jgi:hypothetical protein
MTFASMRSSFLLLYNIFVAGAWRACMRARARACVCV